jgi:3-methyladenine DNA glycosylase/8-oxoguanine DNA glycosylase
MALDPRTLACAAAHVRRADPVMAAIMARVGPCRLRVDPGGGHFAALAESILYQQITGRAAAAIHDRLRVLIGRRHPRAEDIARADDAALRQVGLSRQKVGYLRDLTARVQDGLDLRRLGRLEDEAVIEVLTEVKGIGRWTAEMFLMFRLGRLDVMPVHDYGIRKAMQRAYRRRKLPDPAWMRRVSEPWRPYRSVACWYLWRSVEPQA